MPKCMGINNNGNSKIARKIIKYILKEKPGGVNLC